jgi:hypothetical protein
MLRMKNVHKRYMWDDETKKKKETKFQVGGTEM